MCIKKLRQINQEENEIPVDQPRQKNLAAGKNYERFDPSKQ